MSVVQDAIDAVVTENAQDFLCRQITKNQKFTKSAIPDPLGIGDKIRDVQSAIAEATLQCPNDIDPEEVFGGNPQFEGGQCDTLYDVFYTSGVGCGNPSGPGSRTYVTGPIGEGAVITGTGQYEGQLQVGFYYGGPGGFFTLAATNTACTDAFCNITSVERTDGQPDNCGDLPGSPGQINNTYNDFEELTENEKTINYETSIDYGGDIGVQIVQLPFSNFKMENSLPFTFNFDAGGQTFKIGPDGAEPLPPADKRNEDEPRRDRELLDALGDANTKLEAIKDCVCDGGSSVEVESAVIPLAVCNGSEGDYSSSKDYRTLTVLKGSVTAALIAEFGSSADLGILGCDSLKGVAQQNAMEIWSGEILTRNAIIFSPEIASEVRSIVLEVTSYDNLNVRTYKMAGEQVNADFGWAGWSIDQFSAEGQHTRIVSRETYLRIPDSTKPLRLRIDLKKGVAFTLWDTGERGRLQLPPAA